MRHLAAVLLGGGFLLLTPGIAGADTDWQTVTLDNNPDFTIDVPNVVADNYKPGEKYTKQGDLMFIALTTDSQGDLDCMLSGSRYSKKLPHKDAVAKLSSPVREVLCTSDRKDVDVGESESLTSNGLPASRCAASYTDSSEKQPGTLVSVLAIAAPHKFYLLTCNLHAESKDEAQAEWVLRWSDEVKHIQQSLHLPAGVK